MASASRSTVVCLGESLFDLIADQTGLAREEVKSWTPFAGGAPCNVATALGKLGTDVILVTALGDDKAGAELMGIIEGAGVQTHAVQQRREPTRDVYVTRSNDGDREFAGFGQKADTYCDCFIDAAALPLDDIKSAGLLVTGTLGLAYPACRAAMKAAVAAAKEGGCKVLVDVNWRPVFWEDHAAAKKEITEFLQDADLLKISDSDLEWLLGMDLSIALINPCAVREPFKGATGLLVTAGEEGSAYCFGAGSDTLSGFVPVFKVDAVDTTGSGDCFTAGFIYKMLAAGGPAALAGDSKALKEAVVFGAACGALTATRKGAIEGQPRLEETAELAATAKGWYNFW
ncbi:hypothetical protein FOA52_004053 [Chlamydomonas sp. UWO 241]|nr:hypothetical protein FOA52_004053 [Chlamydomonas sp. UWO 241]